MLVGELLYRGDDLVDRRARPHRGPDGLQPAVERMGVPVAERRHQEPAVEVDLVGACAPRPLARLVAHRAHHAVVDSSASVSPRAGPDHAAGEQRRAPLT